jgi:Do/DeqQ family serine protease
VSDNRTLSKNVKAGGAAAALLAFITLGAWQVPHAGATADAGKPPAAASTHSVPGVPAVTSYASTVEQVTPAVVTIRTQGRARMVPTGMDQQPQLPPGFEDFFGPQFRLPQQPRGRQRALGSGVIVSQDGYILTNNHVIDNADDIKVEMEDKRTFSAKLVGADPATDLAVLKIDARALPILALGDSDAVRVGDVVLAVGNPLGIGQTVTMGIVSAKGRTTGVGNGSGSYEDFLQTDAPINQGNSGGALVSLDGKLVGINSQILSPSGGNIGVGFAIPSNMARSVMDQLVGGGKVHRSRLGVTAQGITADLAASLGLKDLRGALVSKVDDGTAASRAGIRQGDVILSVNGHAVSDSNDLRNRIASVKPGTTVDIGLLRDGRNETVHAKLEELPAAGAGRGERDSEGRSERGRFGLSVQPVTPELAERLELPRGTKGVAIIEIDPDGEAAASGLQKGDVIEKVNGQAVTTAEQLRSALDSTAVKPALLLVTRDGTNIFVTLRAPKS